MSLSLSLLWSACPMLAHEHCNTTDWLVVLFLSQSAQLIARHKYQVKFRYLHKLLLKMLLKSNHAPFLFVAPIVILCFLCLIFTVLKAFRLLWHHKVLACFFIKGNPHECKEQLWGSGFILLSALVLANCEWKMFWSALKDIIRSGKLTYIGRVWGGGRHLWLSLRSHCDWHVKSYAKSESISGNSTIRIGTNPELLLVTSVWVHAQIDHPPWTRNEMRI